MRQHPARKTALLRLQESNKETYNDCGQRIDEKHRDVNQVRAAQTRGLTAQASAAYLCCESRRKCSGRKDVPDRLKLR